MAIRSYRDLTVWKRGSTIEVEVDLYLAEQVGYVVSDANQGTKPLRCHQPNDQCVETQTLVGFPSPSSLAPRPSSLSIQFRTELRLRRSALAEQTRNNPVAMVSSVFNEHFVRIVAGHDHSGDEYPRH